MPRLLTAIPLILVLVVAASAQKVYRAGEDGVTNPKLVEKVEPQYTQEARDAGVEGTVVLGCEISERGKAENITVLRSLRKDLDTNAAKAVEQWKFEPGRKDGKPVRVKATIEVNFRL